MRSLCVKQFGPKDHVTIIHRVAVPDFSEQGFYRSAVSYSAFFHGHKKDYNNFWALHPKTAKANGFRVRKPYHKFWYHMQPWDEFADDCERAKKWKVDMYSKTPVVDHASIWDFYIHIGYDYKTKKYSKGLITKEIKPAEMPY